MSGSITSQCRDLVTMRTHRLCDGIKNGLLGAALSVVLCAAFPCGAAVAAGDAKDWPMYNADSLGTRHNRGETAIDKTNAARLEEKWRFPAKGSETEIGVIHATPIVVNGYVYFGTATDPAFYKLTPEGKVRWSYRNPARAGGCSSQAKFRRREITLPPLPALGRGHHGLRAGHWRHGLFR